MRTSTKMAVVAAGAVVVLTGVAGVAAATGVVGDDDALLTGDELSRAVHAAKAEVAGEVVDTEIGDEGRRTASRSGGPTARS